ncbi:MAG TPA: glycosyltransferase family 87 protein [Coriobacteriia bacterium]|nr:glycosyltransferase family 87 protein [Coriobacteriia bacterium]
MPTQSPSTTLDLSHPKNRRALLITLTVVAGTWLSSVFHYVLGIYRKYPYPLNTFLFKPGRRFDDFYGDLDRASLLLRGHSMDMPYSPFGTSLMGLFSLIPVQKIAFGLALLSFSVVVIAILWDHVATEMRGRATVVGLLVTTAIATMSYPVLFTVDRGNEEIFLFMLLAAFTYLFLKKRSSLAAVALGAAIAYKMYPGVFIVLFIADRKWKELGIAIAAAIGFEALATLALSVVSGFSVPQLLQHWYESLFVGHVGYADTLGAHQHGHSLWGVVTVAYRLVTGAFPSDPMRTAYVVFALVSFVVLSAYVIRFERTDWKRFTLLFAAMLLLPFESHDYTLVHLLIPIALFAEAELDKWDFGYALLFGLLLVPLDYVLLISTVSTSSFLYPALLVAIVCAIVYQRFAAAGVQNGALGKA